MCVLAMAWRTHPRWRFVVAGNRDELHARPAAPLARWAGTDHLLAGRDLLSGGTWMGVSEHGRFAVVTNLRGFEGARTDAPSRGWLLRDNLMGESVYSDPDDSTLAGFSPFNLIRIQGDRADFQTNRPTPSRHELAPGVHGLSNGGLNEPWPKTDRLKAILSRWLDAGAESPERLLGGLQEDHLPRTADLRIPPSDAPFEPAVSPIFIRNPLYGTRCSTVVAVDENGHGVIIERRFNADGAATGHTALPFTWPT